MPDGTPIIPFDLKVAYAQYDFAKQQQELFERKARNAENIKEEKLDEIKAARREHVDFELKNQKLEVCELVSNGGLHLTPVNEGYDLKDPKFYGIIPEDEATRLLMLPNSHNAQTVIENQLRTYTGIHSSLGHRTTEAKVFAVCEQHLPPIMRGTLAETPDPLTQEQDFIKWMRSKRPALVTLKSFDDIPHVASLFIGRVTPRNYSVGVYNYFNTPELPNY